MVRQASADDPDMATIEKRNSFDLRFRLGLLAEERFRQKIDPPEISRQIFAALPV